MSYRAYVLASIFFVTAAADPVGTLIGSRSVAFSPQTGKTYVVDPLHSKLWVVNAARHSSTSIDIGKRPAAVALNTKTGLVYVTLSGEGQLAVLDSRTDSVVSRLAVGPHPYALAIEESSNRVYVTNTFSDIVAVVHGSTNSVDMMHLGSSDNVAADPLTHKIFLIGYEDPALKILDERTGALQKVQVGNHLWGMAVSEQTHTVYLTRVGASELVAVDEDTHQKRIASVGSLPCAVGIDDAARRAFVVNYGDNTVTTFETPSLRKLADASVGSRPQSLLVSHGDGIVFIGNLGSGTVTPIEESTGRANPALPAGSSPYGLGATSKSATPIAANLADAPWTLITPP
jgi:DNA-binding beta-propeller fold protein YncE